MESFRRPGGRRVLLPAEVELCETVGITEDEYFYFIELTQAFNGKRPKEYDNLPYIVNFPALFTATGTLTTFGQIVFGVILTVVSVLLQPKPRAPKTPPSLTTAGITGPKRFAPQTGFNSIQELARLGEVVPLIFTKQETETDGGYTRTHGGVRVNTRLLWSQMLSVGSGQQLKALFMIGLGDLAHKPDFSGFAIGDLLLKNYFNKKLAIYAMTNGGRPQEGLEKYPEGTLPRQKDRNGGLLNDVMSVDWDQNARATETIVSSARTPSTQTIFGAYSPVPNAMRYRVPYELVLKQSNLKPQNKTDVDTKRRKLRTSFPRYCVAYRFNGAEVDLTSHMAVKGDRIDYIIGDMDTESQYGTSFDPWGVEDVKSAVDAAREEADDAIQQGESYLVGEALSVCEGKSKTMWSKKNYQTCFFRVDTRGLVDIRGGIGHRGFFRFAFPSEILTIQKVAIGTISNSKACDVTEIGLKSKVFKQVTSFPNVNSHPGAVGTNDVNPDTTDGVVKSYNEDNGSISLGGMSKYLTRYSFFRLQARVAGIDDIEDNWSYIDEGIPFGVKGNSPQPQYNFIRINHYSVPKKEFEFRFVPFPGNAVRRMFVDQRPIRILSASGELLNYDSKPSDQLFSIYFTGSKRILRKGDVSNTEWFLGDLPTDTDGGKIKEILNTTDGFIPRTTRWVEVERRTPTEDQLTRGVHNATIKYDTDTQGSSWQWGNQRNHPYWNEYIGNRNRTINDPLRNNTFTVGDPYKQPYIDRDGFRFGVGPFVVEQTRRRRPLKKGKYYGMIKYEMKEADVPPTVRNNINVTGGSGSGCKVNIKVYKKPDTNEYAGAVWEIVEGARGSGYKDNDKISIPAIGEIGFPGVNNINIVTDFSEFVTSPWPGGKNLNPFDAITDYYQYDAERSSHQDGPEHEIVYVNEQSDLGLAIPYEFKQAGIANVALRLASSKEWNSFSQFSAYIKEGILVQRLVEDKIGPTNLFPEIVHALLTENRFGLADSIGVSAVDVDRMTVAAKFCEANHFYWDGVITDKQNIREFVYQNAVFNLLDFTILGGKFSLFPSVPYFPDSFKIKRTSKPHVRALFTDGNTRNLKVSFLSPEERQNFIGTVYFRKEVPNGFSETLSKTFTTSTDDESIKQEKFPIEVFDMSDFCTNESHAVEFLKHALMIRKTVDHGIKFETTPQAALGLKPGNYIRFISEATHTSRFENGVISPDGLVQSVGNSPLSDTPIYYWKPGTQIVKEAKLTVTANGRTTNSNLFGAVFTVKQTSESNRLYKVESITYTDEGFIEVSASHAPRLSDGTLATINYNDSDFSEV